MNWPARIHADIRRAALCDEAARNVSALTSLDREAATEIVSAAVKVAIANRSPISEATGELIHQLQAGLSPSDALGQVQAREQFISHLRDTFEVWREEAKEILRDLRHAYPPPLLGPTAVECARLLREKPPAEEE